MSTRDAGDMLSPDDLGSETIIVEFEAQPGLHQTALAPEEIAARSAIAVARAMTTIQAMAEKVAAAARRASAPPDEVTVEFGIKLDAAAGAVIAKAGAGASLTVSLTWRKGDAG